jgi:hypothetical protein
MSQTNEFPYPMGFGEKIADMWDRGRGLQRYRDWKRRNATAIQFVIGFVIIAFLSWLLWRATVTSQEMNEGMYSKRLLKKAFPAIRVREDPGLNDLENMTERYVVGKTTNDYVLANWASDRSVDTNPLNDSMSSGGPLMELESTGSVVPKTDFEFVPMSAMARKSDWGVSQ